MNSLTRAVDSSFNHSGSYENPYYGVLDSALLALEADPQNFPVDKICAELGKLPSDSFGCKPTLRLFEALSKVNLALKDEDFLEKCLPVIDGIKGKIDFDSDGLFLELIPYLYEKFRNNPCQDTVQACAFHISLMALLFDIAVEPLVFQIFCEFPEREQLLKSVSWLQIFIDSFVELETVKADEFYDLTRFVTLFSLEEQQEIAVRHSQKIIKFMESLNGNTGASFETVHAFMDRFHWMGFIITTEEKDWTTFYNYFIRSAKRVIDIVDPAGVQKLANTWRHIARSDDEITYMGWLGLCFVFAPQVSFSECRSPLISLESPLTLRLFFHMSGYHFNASDSYDLFIKQIEAVFRFIKVDFKVWEVALHFLCEMKMERRKSSRVMSILSTKLNRFLIEKLDGGPLVLSHSLVSPVFQKDLTLTEKIQHLQNVSTKFGFSIPERLEALRLIYINTTFQKVISDVSLFSEGVNRLASHILELFSDCDAVMQASLLKIIYLWMGKVLFDSYHLLYSSRFESKLLSEARVQLLINTQREEFIGHLTFLCDKLREK